MLKVGPKTEAALESFRESARITADGVAGPRTNAKLAEALETIEDTGKGGSAPI